MTTVDCAIVCTLRCDGCGAESGSREAAHGDPSWLAVSSVSTGLDFCGWGCLAAYAAKEAAEPGQDEARGPR